MKDHRATIDLVTYGFQNPPPLEPPAPLPSLLAMLSRLISARAFGWSESQPNGLHPGPSHRLNSTLSCVSRRGHSDCRRSVHLRMHTPDQRVCLCAYPPVTWTRSGAQAGPGPAPTISKTGQTTPATRRLGSRWWSYRCSLAEPSDALRHWIDSGIGRAPSSLWNQKYPPVDGRISRAHLAPNENQFEPSY